MLIFFARTETLEVEINRPAADESELFLFGPALHKAKSCRISDPLTGWPLNKLPNKCGSFQTAIVRIGPARYLE